MPKPKALKDSEFSVIERPPSNQNVGLLARLQEAMSTINENAVFQDAALSDPCGVTARNNTGYQACESSYTRVGHIF